MIPPELLDESLYEELENGDVLNKPALTDDPDLPYAVNARNSAGDIVTVKFGSDVEDIESLRCPLQRDPSTPSFWLCKMLGEQSFADSAREYSFTDKVFLDTTTNKIRSVRDGVQEYLGAELGIEPSEKVFKVYRKPETITQIVGALKDLAIIDNHIDPLQSPSDPIGKIESSQVVQLTDTSYDSTLCIENLASFDNEAMSLKDAGKREFSLGYIAKMKEHDQYDFEQYAINPKHLALVDSARGGESLTFMDRGKQMEIHKAFQDAEGEVNLQKVMEIVSGLPEAVQSIPLNELEKLAPVLEEVMVMAKPAVEAEVAVDEEETEEATEEEAAEEAMDEEPQDESDEEAYTDSKAFKDALNVRVNESIRIIEKARLFLDDTYSFIDKDIASIMKDAIATVSKEKVSAEELPIAFKFIKAKDKMEFTDNGKGKLSLIADKEI